MRMPRNSQNQRFIYKKVWAAVLKIKMAMTGLSKTGFCTGPMFAVGPVFAADRHASLVSFAWCPCPHQ